MFELQPNQPLHSKARELVIAWACLSCNSRKIYDALLEHDSYRLGMFELQRKLLRDNFKS